MTQKITYKELEKQFHELEQESAKRKLAEEALKQKINELNSFINNIPDMAWLKDKDSRFIAANKAFCEAAGMDEEFLLNESCEVCFGKEAAKKFKEDDRKVMKGKKQVIIEEKIIDAQNNEVWLETIKSPILNEKGQPVGTVGIARNITERKQAEKENIKLQSLLRQSQKMEAIGTLAGGISHDFNNILAIIIGNIELAYENVPSWNPAYKNLKQAEEACHRARDIVRQILSFSRQQTSLEQKPVNMSQIIKESLKLLRSSIPSTIEIRQNIGCETDMIMAEPTQINQVLINLCTNAYHAMYEKGGILEVNVEKKKFNPGDQFPCPDMTPGSYMVLTVGDTGCGMDHDTMERIFDPYFTTKQFGKGSGMGLAVVHGIVTNHQGFIAVESEPGKGSVFKIYLPVIGSETILQTTPPEEPIPTGNERILLVDDEEPVADMLNQILERLGYQVTTVTNSQEALDIFMKQPGRFDIVITDMTMPNIPGDLLAQKFLDLQSEIPIILCTGFNEQISEEKAKKIGIRELLMKPVSKKEIAKVIRQVLDH